MKKMFLFTSLILLSATNTYAGVDRIDYDTTKPSYSILKSGSLDSNILIVVNGNIAGTIRELKMDIATAFHPETIESINVLKGPEAEKKYGERGKAGVLEITLKKVKIETITISDENNRQKTDADDDNIVFEKVEVEASFPGGAANWRKYLERNLDANIPSDNYAPSGTYQVIVRFLVDKQGVISEIKPLTSHGFGMEEEVVRVIKQGPFWSPAIQNGRIVKAYRNQLVTFVILRGFELSTYKFTAGKENRVTVLSDEVKAEDFVISFPDAKVSMEAPGVYNIFPEKAGRFLLTVLIKKKDKQAELGKVWVEVN
ncbi:MAG: energy transducer TonB [Bacteroidota bacterium]